VLNDICRYFRENSEAGFDALPPTAGAPFLPNPCQRAFLDVEYRTILR
jgi:hypothetical protein